MTERVLVAVALAAQGAAGLVGFIVGPRALVVMYLLQAAGFACMAVAYALAKKRPPVETEGR